VRFALRASTVAHVLTCVLFAGYGILVGFGWPWVVGLALAVLAFAYQHSIVRPDDLSRVNRAFFTANGFVGIALFVFALLDLVLRGGLR
jgi:4-hydroxybenzoate polyprenyltransferase